jgi:hypothetical protein
MATVSVEEVKKTTTALTMEEAQLALGVIRQAGPSVPMSDPKSIKTIQVYHSLIAKLSALAEEENGKV